MKRAQLPPVPQLSLTRKKSQQVPTNDRVDRSQATQPYLYNPQHSQSASRLTINSISRVQSPVHSRVSNSSISRDAYLMEPMDAPSIISYNYSRISNIPQQSFHQISSASSRCRQNYYVPQLLNTIENQRLQIQIQIKTQHLIKEIDMKELLFKQKMKRLLDHVTIYERELEVISVEESINETSILQLNGIKNQSLQLGRSCVFEMEKLLSSC